MKSLMKKILVTGFEPFGEDDINPSEKILEHINGLTLRGGEVVTCLLPVVREKSINQAILAIEQHKPDVVILLGQAAGRDTITPEKVAINFDDFSIPDNLGQQVTDEPIVVGGPDAYFSTLPIKAISKEIELKGIPAKVSYTAGTFVCNHLFYGVRHYLRDSDIRCGFIHIPLMDEQNTQGDLPSLPITDLIKATVIAAQSCIDYTTDIKEQGGQIS